MRHSATSTAARALAVQARGGLQGEGAPPPTREARWVLEQLAALAQWATAQSPVPAVWDGLQDTLRACREAHLRNIQLMQRQLQAVRGALQALQGQEAAAVDLYDRLGRMSRPQGNWSQHLA